MRKTSADTLSPGELYREVRQGVEQLGQLAAALGVSLPDYGEELGRLTHSEIINLWTTSRGSLHQIDEAWNDNAERLVAQYLETASHSPDASAFSS
jgi:hypothetical protein